jgi:hypothetical protein
VNVTKRCALFGRILGAALLMAGLSTTARAQDAEPYVPHMWSVKAGGFFPTNGTLRSQTGAPYYAVGFDYDPNLRYRPLNGRVVLSGEILYRESGGAKELTVPLTAKVLWTLTSPESRFHAYGGLGLGAYIINTGFIGNTTQPGVKFVLGVDFSRNLFLEVNYDYIGGYTDNIGQSVRNDGLTFYIGKRF